MEYVAGIVVEFLVRKLAPLLRLFPWALVKLFPNSRIARWLPSWETKLLRRVSITWIHEARALKIVNTFGFIHDQIREYIDPFDVIIDSEIGLTVAPNRTRIEREMSDYGESVPNHALVTFVEQNPLAKRAGMYNKQALISWLQEYQREWERMLEENLLYKYGNHLTPGLAEVGASSCGLHLLLG